MMIELNEFQRLGALIAHEGLFKSVKNAFLNDPKCQKQGFMDLQLVDLLDIAYYAKTKCVLTFGNTVRS